MPDDEQLAKLLETNNELLDRFLTILIGWEVPEQYRPLVTSWRHRINLPSGSHPANGLCLDIEVLPDCIRVNLDTYDGNRLRTLIVPYTGKPIPNHG